MSLSFEPVPFDVIRDPVCAHLNALPGRIDSFVESHIICSNHYLLKSAGKVAGFASIHESALITQFAMEPAFRYLGQQSYSGLKRLEQVRSAYVPTSDEFFLAHALDDYREVKKQAFLFRLGQPTAESGEFALRLAGAGDIDSIVQESGEFFENLQQNIDEQDIFITTANGEPAGYGVIERSKLYGDIASIGMFTIERFRGQGVGAATIRGLIRVTQSRDLEPIAGCWYYNHRSKKTLEGAGMYAASRLLRVEY